MRSITFKLILGFLGIGLVSVGIVVFLARQNTKAEFNRFVSNRYQSDLKIALTDYYAARQSWEGVEDALRRTQGVPPNEPDSKRSSPYVLADAEGRVALAGGKYDLGDQIPQFELDAGIQIESNGETVGVLILDRVSFGENPLEAQFIRRTNELLLFSALGATIIASLLGIFLSRTLTRPVRELILAAHAMSAGDLAQQVPVRSRDELGELARAFNRMSAELARSIRSRRQMTADIAHELRTPLSLILGHAEAVHDGVLQPTAENFEIIREEAERLERLVDDLRILSLADAGELSLSPESIDIVKLLGDIKTLYAHRFNRQRIALDLEADPASLTTTIDPARMTQVIANVLDNSLQYAPEGARVVISVRKREETVELVVEDDGPGVKPEEAERLFDRLYRADPSRQRDGGSGLGLAISKSIVEMHGGRIWAELVSPHGMRIVIQLTDKRRIGL